jgi:hypothetical protein
MLKFFQKQTISNTMEDRVHQLEAEILDYAYKADYYASMRDNGLKSLARLKAYDATGDIFHSVVAQPDIGREATSKTAFPLSGAATMLSESDFSRITGRAETGAAKSS